MPNHEVPRMITVPDELKPTKNVSAEVVPAPDIIDQVPGVPRSTRALLGSEAAAAAEAAVPDGKFGNGVVETKMPPDPSKVPGWDGQVRR